MENTPTNLFMLKLIEDWQNNTIDDKEFYSSLTVILGNIGE